MPFLSRECGDPLRRRRLIPTLMQRETNEHFSPAKIWSGTNASNWRLAQVGERRTTQAQEYYQYDAGGLRAVKETLQQAHNVTHRETVVYLPGLEYRSCRQGNDTTESLAVILAGNVQVLHWNSENEVPSGMSNGCVRYSLSGTTGMNSMELDEKGNIISAEEYFPYGGSTLPYSPLLGQGT